ncbi:MAG: indole-3-glycerol phosphate synthase TrpC [Actinomycetota bacterium]|nr:indole-3-glycerol phosphate synthase TrpC [Actinomycetota bacterium]
MLDQIISDARARADDLEGCGPMYRKASASLQPVQPFSAALRGSGLSIVAEVKRRSPSRGVLAAGLDAVAQAQIYESAGADAVSVLTEPSHFDGSLDDLAMVRDAVSIPVLRKDFLLEPAQVWEARAFGADAVLLIVAVLGRERLGLMMDAAADAGVDALVEAHDEHEAEIAIEAGATLIGINNRDLKTFETDLAVAERAAELVVRPGITTVAESGIHDPGAAKRMESAGYDAILVGEALIVASDPAATVTRLIGRS